MIGSKWKRLRAWRSWAAPEFISGKNRRLIGRLIDPWVRVRPKRVVFVSKATVPIMGNLRVVLDALADHRDCEVGVYRQGDIPVATRKALQAKSVRVMATYTVDNLLFILSAECVVLSHSARDAYIVKRKKGRRVVNLWHGVALKRIESLMLTQEGGRSFVRRMSTIDQNGQLYDAMIAASELDRTINALAFRVPLNRVYALGLPRFDYLDSDYVWPSDLEAQCELLSGLVGGRRLIVYAPTFRSTGISLAHLLDNASVAKIRAFCVDHDVAFGIRPHPYQSESVQCICDGRYILDLAATQFPEPAVLLKAADVLVADYSSIWVDYLLLGRPIVGFTPDLDRYISADRDFIYDYVKLFPGERFSEWEPLLLYLEQCLADGLSNDAQQRLKSTKGLLIEPEKLHQSAAHSAAALIRKGLSD